MQHHAPIAQLIAEALEHQSLFIRDDTSGLVLLLQVGHDIGARIVVGIRNDIWRGKDLAAILT